MRKVVLVVALLLASVVAAQAGPTYFYVARTVDVNGFESGNSNQVTVTFGLNPDGSTQHIVNLSWTAAVVPPGGAAIAGYNIYRGTVSGGPYTKINTAAIVTGTTYSDPFVLPNAPTGLAGTPQ